MAKKGKEVVVETESEELEAVVEKPEEKGEASVYTSTGQYVRTYSFAEHGKDYKKLAEMFRGKIKGIVK